MELQFCYFSQAGVAAGLKELPWLPSAAQCQLWHSMGRFVAKLNVIFLPCTSEPMLGLVAAVRPSCSCSK